MPEAPTNINSARIPRISNFSPRSERRVRLALGIDRVAVPKLAAVFSAFGIGACDISQRYALVLEERSDAALAAALESLKLKASRDMFAEGFGPGQY